MLARARSRANRVGGTHLLGFDQRLQRLRADVVRARRRAGVRSSRPIARDRDDLRADLGDDGAAEIAVGIELAELPLTSKQPERIVHAGFEARRQALVARARLQPRPAYGLDFGRHVKRASRERRRAPGRS